MKNRLYVISLFLISFMVLCASFQCALHDKKNKPSIVVTTTMLKDLLLNLLGDDACVQTLMGPGIDPHVYRPRESDIHRLLDADLIFYHGLHLEGKMAHMFELMNSWKPTYNVSTCIPESELIATMCAGIYDPHVWHDISLWIMVAHAVAKQLKKQFPYLKTKINVRLKKYEKLLISLDTAIKNKLSSIVEDKRIIITAHDAFSYLGKRYGIKVVGLQGVSTDSEIGTFDINTLADIIETYRVGSIFLESSIAGKSIHALEQAVRMRGLQVSIGEELFSDALADVTSSAHSYVGMMKHNINAFLASIGEAIL